MKELYVAWRDPEDRTWLPVGLLRFDGDSYLFVYTQGAKQSPRFSQFARMEDFTTTYKSNELFPLFANRVLSKKRPEYREFLQWLNIPEDCADVLTVLARTGGIRETDSLALFPRPERGADNTYRVQFFSHGIRHLSEAAVQRISGLVPKERLYLMPDLQNPHDACALALRTDNPVSLVGYCPRYFASDFLAVLESVSADETRVHVERVNEEAPLQLRLLCSLTAPWPDNFQPCSSRLYQPLV